MSLMNEYAAPAAGFPSERRNDWSSIRASWLLAAATLALMVGLQRWLEPAWWGASASVAPAGFRGLITIPWPSGAWPDGLAMAAWAAVGGGLWLVSSKAALRGQAVTAALCLSPAVILALQSGGSEAFTFLLCAAAIRANERYPMLTAGLIAVGFFVALYPVMLLAILETRSRPGRRAMWLTLLVIVIGVAALLTTGAGSWSELMGSPTSVGFGLLAVSDWVADAHPRWFRTAVLFQVCGVIAPVVLAAMWRAAAMPLLGRRSSETLFLAGALLHVGAFLCGVNACDRLIVLLLCVPWLVERSGRYAILNGMIALIALALWQPKLAMMADGFVSEDRLFVLRQTVNWAIFVVLATVVCASAIAHAGAWWAESKRARAVG